MKLVPCHSGHRDLTFAFFLGQQWLKRLLLAVISATLSAAIMGGGVATLSAQYVDESLHQEGLHQYKPQRYAVTGAKIVTDYGSEIAAGTIVVDQGKIVAIGESDKIVIPDGVPTIDLSGKTIYPGLIDAYQDVTIEAEAGKQAYWNAKVRPEFKVVDYLTAELTNDSARRSQGIVAAHFAPKGNIIDGAGAVAMTGGPENAARRVLKENVGHQAQLTVSFRTRGSGYPSSPMGAVALARQALYDATWYREAWQVAMADPSVERPEVNTSLAALSEVIQGQKPLFVEAANELFVLRADRFAREFGTGLVIVGSGNEYRRLDEVISTGRAIICPLNFPKAPNVETLAEARGVSLETLMHWDHAPENPGRLANAGVKLALTTRGLESPSAFLKQVRIAVERGLKPADALKALTLGAAEILGVEDQLGSLSKGKLASFVVTDGDLFAEKTKVLETWVAGTRYELKPEPISKLDAKWNLTVAKSGDQPEVKLQVEIKARGERLTMSLVKSKAETAEAGKSEASKPSESVEPADTGKADTESSQAGENSEASKAEPGTAGSEKDEAADAENTDSKSKAKPEVPLAKFDKVKLEGVILAGTLQGTALNAQGVARWNLIVDAVESDSLLGRFVWPDGTVAPLLLEKISAAEETENSETESESSEAAGEAKPAADEASTEKQAESKAEAAEKSADDTEKTDTEKTDTEKTDAGKSDAGNSDAGKSGVKKAESKSATFPVNYPLGAFGTTELPEQAESVLLQNFTVWTSGPEGILEGASVLIRQGKIAGVYAASVSPTLPEGTVVIQGQGRHLSPGIIDCHSHMATDSGVNEGSQAITAEVRVGDLIDPDDMTIYRQLAGGTTSANILHGSANPIGGQNQIIKLRWGVGEQELKFAEAPQGIKFALGENVKRSNGGQQQTRYPASRMGVEQIIRDAFYSANEYRLQHRQWEIKREGLPPRVDLELKALAEIVEGQRWVHCHSYRQDEILALIRTLDEFGVQIGTFQHILEGYKVADSMQKHGAMASAFADWWAYKLEVADAIPYAGSIMHNQGVVVSFNSDDGELGRRLNHEAAKAVKYGGVDPAEALKFVTLNPARQLRVDQYVGSIEVGKHADLVIWNGSPLSTLSRVDQTWIDGRKYFDRELENKQRGEFAAMRQKLIQKILDTGSEMAAPGEATDADTSDLWPRYDEYCKAKGQH